MEIRDLEYLVASATAGNFGRAAESIGISTSTISRHVARVEDELGLALFERGHSGVRLTPGGRAVMLHVQRVLGELDALKCSGTVSGAGDVGEIRLGVRLPPTGTPLVSLLAGWRARNPNIILTLAEMNDRDLVAAVEERRLDVVLTASQALWPRAASVPLYRDPLVAVLPAAHPLARRTRRALGRPSRGCRSGPGLGREPGRARVLCRVPRRGRPVPGASRQQAKRLRPGQRGVRNHLRDGQSRRGRVRRRRVQAHRRSWRHGGNVTGVASRARGPGCRAFRGLPPGRDALAKPRR